MWIFQVAQNLTLSSGAAIALKGGARADNVFWPVSGPVDLGTTAHVEGIVLTQTSATLNLGPRPALRAHRGHPQRQHDRRARAVAAATAGDFARNNVRYVMN